MIIDGKAIAAEIYADLGAQYAALGKKVRLGIIVVGANPVIEQFVRIKSRAAAELGIDIVRTDVVEDRGTAGAIDAIRALAPSIDALIVQLPLPKSFDTNAVLEAIPREKDVDALNPATPEDRRLVDAPVALAVLEILKRSNVRIAGQKVVVVGAGRLVGTPAAVLLRKMGADVSFFSLDEGSIDDLRDADIVICGAGKPGFIKPMHVKTGSVLIDAGASEDEGVVRGDLDPVCAEKASLFTPVPGGVGPIAVAMIFKNLLHLLRKEG
ncbi:bifunctional 5,10-methylenetetrahydrofolate dehydrogenase/5,10-methenyltetrahydrofolate cyclohydrolase [Candidatus Kaiserbacteria bacterium]|nr:bifunctional 5,10-methylenetetrahydrofolate dehydrogenase/5,10-methenyltetrahydrofolate cyclohydrolase [Candidatus Kaiserbacteria bacterium]